MRWLLLLSLVPLSARAENLVGDPGAPWVTAVGLPRSTAMGGAGAAIATSNDALTLNPAGLAQIRRYHFEIDGMYDSRFPAQGITASIVDSASSAVGSGLLFSRWATGQPAGRGEGWSIGLGYSGAVGQNLFFGGQTKYLRFHTPDGLVAKWAQDVGFLSRKGGFAWGAVLHNVSLDKLPLFPLTATAAVAWGTDADWHLAIDYNADLSDSNHIKHKAAVGGEVLIDEGIALRGGATWDATADIWWASGGIGFLTEKGALQLVWRRRMTGPLDQFFQAGITLYLE
jgi:hypothetical protein